MTMTAEDTRRFLAEEIRVSSNLRHPRLIEALGSVPRERFLPPGPWLIRGMFDTGPRLTDDADPRHVYHDVAIAIDPSRTLYNGQPSLIAKWLESLEIREAEHVLRSVMPKVVALKAAEHDPVRTKEAGAADFILRRPTRRAIGRDGLGFPRPPDRHADRDPDRREAAGGSNARTLDEDAWRISVVVIPPPEKDHGHINRRARNLEPRQPKLRLEAEPPCSPLRGRPLRREHDRKDDDDLSPEDLRSGQGLSPCIHGDD
jgi:hypothetical protein